MLAAAVVLMGPVASYAEGEMGDMMKPSPAGEPSHEGWKDHHAQEAKMMAQVLVLSEDQQKLLEDNHQKQQDAMKAAFEQMKTNKEALDAEIIKAVPDMKKVNDLQTQLKAIQSQMADDRFNSLLATKKILTPEQFAGYMALEKQEKLMRRHEGREQFGPKGQFCKMGDMSKHEADKPNMDQDKDKE